MISIHEPGFAWLARMQAAPLVSVRVLDCYVGGAGLLDARLFGSLSLARAAGAQATKGELMRYLAELAWTPHAMLRNPQLSWREINASNTTRRCRLRPRLRLQWRNCGRDAPVRMLFREHQQSTRPHHETPVIDDHMRSRRYRRCILMRCKQRVTCIAG